MLVIQLQTLERIVATIPIRLPLPLGRRRGVLALWVSLQRIHEVGPWVQQDGHRPGRLKMTLTWVESHD